MNSNQDPRVSRQDPLEEDIRAYAYHLYEQSGRQGGHELEHWLEAKACILANIPQRASHSRLHHHLSAKPAVVVKTTGFTMPPSDAALVQETSAPRVRVKSSRASNQAKGTAPEVGPLREVQPARASR